MDIFIGGLCNIKLYCNNNRINNKILDCDWSSACFYLTPFSHVGVIGHLCCAYINQVN